MKYYFWILLFLCQTTIASRIPDSLIRDQYISTEGFGLNFKDSHWLRTETPGNIKSKMDVLFRSVIKNSQSTFSVRVDYDEDSHSLKEYINKWIKTYSSFKIEVLGRKYFKTSGDETGFVIDVKSNPEKRTRQVVFFKNSKAVVLTCSDLKNNFSETLKQCNDIIKTFTWVEAAKESHNPI